MPELPEIEVITRQLTQYLVGYRVVFIEISSYQVVKGDLTQLVGHSVTGVRRRGKGIIIDFDSGLSLAVHLKMTGQIIFRDGNKLVLSSKVGDLPGAHTHVVMKLEKEGSEALLYYNDIRRFGWLHALPTKDIPDHPFFKMLGLEPFRDLDLEGFCEILSGARTPIKTLLMDQSKIAGIGNIYANEALWMSKIHPKRPSLSLTSEECALLYASIIEVLEKSLSLGASSENTYVNALGQEGEFQKYFQVYHREGTACPRCGAIIERFMLGGRGTFICPQCQEM